MDYAPGRVHRIPLLLAPFFLVACGSSGSEPLTPTSTDAAAEVAVDAGPDTSTVVDTGTVHVPKAPRCELPDGGAAETGIDDASVDGSSDAATDGGTVAFPPMQALNAGGRVFHHARVVPITFKGNDWRDDLEDFIASVGCTDYWRAIGAEYGVHELTSGVPIHVDEPAPAKISDKGIETWLRGQLTAKTPGFEQPGPETIYAIYYPSDTTVKLSTLESCRGFGGFHKSFKMPDGSDVAYAVMMDCSGSLDDLTSVTSHELIEAATDPIPFTAPAYSDADADHAAYWFRTGGEVADLCETIDRAGQTTLAGYPFVVQRSWSNAAALAGHDPCVPMSGTYFNVVPEVTDTVPIITSGGVVDTKGIKMAVGETKTITLQLFADGPIDSWKLSVKTPPTRRRTSRSRSRRPRGAPAIASR